jgi:hypothetical protein
LRAVDLPTPRIREVKRAADLTRTTMRHIEESSRIAATPPVTFGEVEHDATGSTLDLICGVSAVPPKLHDHGTQRSNQIQCNVIGNQHVFVSCVGSSLKGETPPADGLRGWATPVATDPREDP